MGLVTLLMGDSEGMVAHTICKRENKWFGPCLWRRTLLGPRLSLRARGWGSVRMNGRSRCMNQKRNRGF